MIYNAQAVGKGRGAALLHAPKRFIREVSGLEGRSAHFTLMQLDVSSESMTTEKPHCDLGCDSCCLMIIPTGLQKNTSVNRYLFIFGVVFFFIFITFIPFCILYCRPFTQRCTDKQRKVAWILLASTIWRLCVVLVRWRPACVDLPGMTWTLSVPMAASCLALCVSALIWNPTLMAYTVGWAACGYVEGGNPAVWVSPLFSQSGFLSLRPVITVLPAERDSRHGLVDLAAPPSLSFPFSLSLPSLQQPPKHFRPPAPIIQRLPPDGPVW